MLAEEKLPVSLRDGEILPRYLTEADHPWLRALLDEYERFAGRPRRELKERLREPLPVKSPDLKRRLAIEVADRLTRARCNARVPPASITGSAASLACGYLGMVEKLKPRAPVEGSAYRLAHTLPRTLYDALARFNASKPVKGALGEKFVEAVTLVKDTELLAYQQVISSWEREHLLLNV